MSDGVRLFFNSRMQTLQLIDVYDVKKIPLVHQNVIFGGANDMAAATFGHLYELFGPTYGGKFNSDYDAYLLKYKAGLSILFPLPLEMQDQYRDGYAKNLNLPVEFPDGSTPVLKRLLLYRGSSHTKIDMVPCAVENYMERVQVRILDDERRGLYFTQRSCALDLGALPEEIMGKLGRPVDIYYKKVLSVSSETTTMGVSPRDYFLNYDHLGIDFLISGETNALVKIILHTNVVGHADFGTYLKCNFHLEMKHGKKKTDRSYIDPDMTWEKIVEEWVHLKDARPVIQNHNATSTTTTSLHPFGPTYYYTLFPGCVVEVGHLYLLSMIRRFTHFRMIIS